MYAIIKAQFHNTLKGKVQYNKLIIHVGRCLMEQLIKSSINSILNIVPNNYS